MVTPKYCGDRTEYECGHAFRPDDLVVQARREVFAGAYGDTHVATRDLVSIFLADHVPSGWVVVAGPDRYAIAAFD